MQYDLMDGYKLYKICRFCGVKLDAPVIDLGHMPLAGGFLRSKQEIKKEKLFPLTLSFCKNCYLLQTREVIEKDTLFKNYFYFSSAIRTLVDHFDSLVKEFTNYKFCSTNPLLIEIGCNDGSFIKACRKKNLHAVGVDPATNIVTPLIKKGLPLINDYFTEEVAEKIIKDSGKASIIFSSNTLAHIEDMHTVMKGILSLLDSDGILVFEVHYLGSIINQLQYDMIYHEHQYYYSIATLKKFLKQFDLEIFDLRFTPIHAGSVRIYAQKRTGKRAVQKIVKQTLQQEKQDGLTTKRTFIQYNKRIKKVKDDLLSLLTKLKKQKKKIAGYGASGRGTIVMNYSQLTKKYLDYVIDDAPAKQNTYTPGNHLKVFSSQQLLTSQKPDYVVLFAWSFWEEIKKRNQKYIASGGKFIVPLPAVRIV